MQQLPARTAEAARSGPVDQQERLATAYHEAGHAVVALALGHLVERVSIVSAREWWGYCDVGGRKLGPRLDGPEPEVLISLGGLVAEARRMGDYCRDGASDDLRDARELIRKKCPNEKRAARLEQRLLRKTEHLLDHVGRWKGVELIASEVLIKSAISGRLALHLYREALAISAR